MLVAFANNQAMTAPDGTASTIVTDPVALGSADRATANFNVHYIFGTGGSAPDIAYQAQVSNDGTNWVNVGALLDSTNTPTGNLPRQVIADVNGAYIRFEFSLTASGGSGIAGVGFDLHVLLDHK